MRVSVLKELGFRLAAVVAICALFATEPAEAPDAGLVTPLRALCYVVVYMVLLHVHVEDNRRARRRRDPGPYSDT